MVETGLADKVANTADPLATVTPLRAPTDAEDESTSVKAAVAPLQAAGRLLTVTAVTLPAVTVQVVVAPASEPQDATATKPAPIVVDVVVMPPAQATVGGPTTAQSTTRTSRALRQHGKRVMTTSNPSGSSRVSL